MVDTGPSGHCSLTGSIVRTLALGRLLIMVGKGIDVRIST
jgi:hypothetical protein